MALANLTNTLKTAGANTFSISANAFNKASKYTKNVAAFGCDTTSKICSSVSNFFQSSAKKLFSFLSVPTNAFRSLPNTYKVGLFAATGVAILARMFFNQKQPATPAAPKAADQVESNA